MYQSAIPSCASPDRRSVLLTLGGALALPLVASCAGQAFAAPLGELELYGPPAGPSVILARAAASGALSRIADKASFRAWRNPDEMRAGLTSGTMRAVVLPVQVAASLYNRGFGLKLLNVMTKGLLYVISADTGVTSLADLKGKRLAVPFRNDMPDLVLARLLPHYRLSPGTDLAIETVGSPVEAIQMLMAGRVDAVLAPEPAISAAIMLAGATGKTLARVIDIQEVWGEVSGGPPVLPQAGLALTDAFTQADPDIAEALQAALEKVAAEVNAEPEKAAADAAPALEMPAPVIAASIANSRLVAQRASTVRTEIEAMLAMLSDADPGLIGGRLPDDGFYL
ncbi:ABC transporter substrate-binding protein [Aquamicrobium defluvii]|uniref:NitT/TauT family transport system substrate-binding protein n=1 Tax=Aquamicrobium defluvii TaxID=69279 RepID=A0A011U8Y4_9HYPH|nr:ABC transporter substrate-binding protein [Aquamicrobium defluvii]EXL02328.1 taurine ABC transporter substrate-binding protein [Aquamicrobium defluvii]EZQ13042.1 taurine ABC transporter substrate-binding protein [Halopseudomonas bauzanensis]TDR32658.1 NitT/TauT family transport system substrate-binding protein [Aquamicrobium defluvii]